MLYDVSRFSIATSTLSYFKESKINKLHNIATNKVSLLPVRVIIIYSREVCMLRISKLCITEREGPIRQGRAVPPRGLLSDPHEYNNCELLQDTPGTRKKAGLKRGRDGRGDAARMRKGRLRAVATRPSSKQHGASRPSRTRLTAPAERITNASCSQKYPPNSKLKSVAILSAYRE